MGDKKAPLHAGGSVEKNLPVKAQETRVRSLEKEMATHSSILAWKNPMDREDWRATAQGVAKVSDMT